jgi:tetratricopeptide (TPR) repeat protein
VTTCALAVVVNWPLDVTEGRWLEGLRLVQQLAIHHQYEEAGSWASRLDANHPPNPGAAHYGLGAQLLQLNDPSRALPYLEEAARMDPRNAQADYAYGQALLRTRGAAAALPHLKRGFEAGIELPLGGFDYADALHDIGDLRGAAQAAQRVTLPENAGADILLKMGRLAFEAGQPAEAERFFRTAVQVDPDQASAHQQLGLNLLILERYEEAAHELSEAVRLDPKDPDSLAHLAYCEAKLGNADGARMHAQAALAIDPSNQLARQILTLLRSSPDPR